MRVEQAPRDEFPKICSTGKNGAARTFWGDEWTIPASRSPNPADKIRCVVPKERGFRKTDRQREVRHHSLRIDTFLSKTGRKIDRINSRIDFKRNALISRVRAFSGALNSDLEPSPSKPSRMTWVCSSASR